MISDKMIFALRKKSALKQKNIYMLAAEHFSVSKHRILIGLCEVAEKFVRPFLELV